MLRCRAKLLAEANADVALAIIRALKLMVSAP